MLAWRLRSVRKVTNTARASGGSHDTHVLGCRCYRNAQGSVGKGCGARAAKQAFCCILNVDVPYARDQEHEATRQIKKLKKKNQSQTAVLHFNCCTFSGT